MRGILTITNDLTGQTRITPACAGNTQICGVFWLWNFRITPACAGNTDHLLLGCNVNRDHPRMCGEYRFVFARCFLISGSPPHVRGILRWLRSHQSADRITPACAGNTLVYLSDLSRIRDHPRMCGEYILIIRGEKLMEGSPPHVRGIHST